MKPLEPQSIEALRIDVKNKDLNDQYSSLASNIQREYFRLNHPEWVDDQNRIEAHEIQFAYDNRIANKRVVEAYVQYKAIPKNDTAAQRAFRKKNPEFDLWGQMVLGWNPITVTSSERKVNQMIAIGRAIQ
jgi:hypothetical protein